MTTSYKFQCKCGSLAGEVQNSRSTMRVVCYCKDCQAFANHLGGSESILDDNGGTDIIATPANKVTFNNGKNNLACLSLSEQGLLRWYAKCCNTPIANTPRDWKFPYVGLVHNGYVTDRSNKDSSLPEVQMYLNSESGESAPHSSPWRKAKTILGFMPKIVVARLSGRYKNTPFFSTAGTPVSEVTVLQ